MFKKINKHMPDKVPNPAEEFRPSKEDKFPNLTAEYWADPNSQRGMIETCSYSSGIKESSKRSEGI